MDVGDLYRGCILLTQPHASPSLQSPALIYHLTSAAGRSETAGGWRGRSSKLSGCYEARIPSTVTLIMVITPIRGAESFMSKLRLPQPLSALHYKCSVSANSCSRSRRTHALHKARNKRMLLIVPKRIRLVMKSNPIWNYIDFLVLY